MVGRGVQYMFWNKKEKSNDNSAKHIKIDTTIIRKNAGKRLDSQSQSQQCGIVNLNEGAGITLEYFTKNENKKNDD
jgi:hypothetical protein